MHKLPAKQPWRILEKNSKRKIVAEIKKLGFCILSDPFVKVEHPEQARPWK